MSIPLTPTTISGIIGLISLICGMIFGILIQKGAIFFKLHRIFSIITIISVLTHAYLVISKFF